MNTCKCQNPPGGTIICEADQFATCSVINGQIEGRCITPSGSTEEIANFILDDSSDGPRRFILWLASEVGLQPERIYFLSEGMEELRIQGAPEENASILQALVSRDSPGEFILLGTTTGEAAREATIRVRLPSGLVEHLMTGRSSRRYATF